MTVLDASGLLFEWFAENDSFNLSEDFKRIVLVTDSPERDRVAVTLALSNLEETGVIKKSSYEEENYWVLTKPFSTYEQTVSVSPLLAASISKVINDYCEYLDDKTDLADPSNLQEKDLQNMFYICNKFLENKS